MSPNFKIKSLTLTVSILSSIGVAHAAGLDRSGQDITAFLQDGTYAEATYTYIDADVTGYDNARAATAEKDYVQGKKIDDIAEPYDFFRYGVKTDINDTFSVGVLYDEPWGAAAKYPDGSNFAGAPTQTINAVISKVANDKGLPFNNLEGLKQYTAAAEQKVLSGQQNLKQGIQKAQAELAQAKKLLEAAPNPQAKAKIKEQIEQSVAEGQAKIAAAQQQLQAGEANVKRLQGLVKVAEDQLQNTEATNVEVRSESVSGILGMKLGEQKQLQIYGGPVAQRVSADVKLRGDAYGQATNYTAHISPDEAMGWLAGVSYSKPEIGLKAALTYRSEIEHKTNIAEEFPLAVLKGLSPNQSGEIKFTTPESVNLDFQTGLNPTTLATAKVRYVPWSKFKIQPPAYTTLSGLNLVDYSDDQWQVELGVGKRLSPKVAVSGTVGWDSGAGNPTTSLGPIEGYYSAGLGAKVNLNENWAISAGGKYLWLGDAKGNLPNGDVVADFKDNTGYIAGVKLSYQSK